MVKSTTTVVGKCDAGALGSYGMTTTAWCGIRPWLEGSYFSKGSHHIDMVILLTMIVMNLQRLWSSDKVLKYSKEM